MEIRVSSEPVELLEDELVLVSLFQDSLPRTKLVQDLDEALGGRIRHLVEMGDFTGRFLQTETIFPMGQIQPRRVMIVGLGPEKAISLERLRQASAHAAREIAGLGLDGFSSMVHGETVPEFKPARLARALVEGATLASHQLQTFRTDRDRTHHGLQRLRLITPTEESLEALMEGAREGTIHALAANLARDLLTCPANVMDIEGLVDRALDLNAVAQEEDVVERFTISTLRRPELEEQGCGGILGVGQGSVREPCMVVMVWRGASTEDASLTLVGKGVTFDSGGLSLKAAASMEHGKFDKTGAAVVIAVMRAAIRLKLPLNLVGVIPMAENMPSGNAMRPGDVITMASGLTVEVANTDAEGRLLLADALHYAQRFRPAAMIDLATLTGTVAQTFGQEAIGILGNSAGLMAGLIAAGEMAGERAWPLPLWEAYGKKIESHQADLRNTGGRYAGTITAAKFLQRFVGDIPWVHLDVAGPIWIFDDSFYSLHGPTGAGVRLILHFLGYLVERIRRGESLEGMFLLSRDELGHGTLPGITEQEPNVSLTALARELADVSQWYQEG